MRIVDPHVHFWDVASGNYPWLEHPAVAFSGDNRLLPKHYGPDTLLTDAVDLEVIGTVHVEANPRDAVAEVAWLETLAADAGTRHPTGIVAYADLTRPDAMSLLEALARFPRVRGVRQIVNRHMDPRFNYADRDYLIDAVWLDNLRHLARLQWSFDLQLYPEQVAVAAPVIRRNPTIPFIVNHAGMFVDRRSVAGWRQWRLGLRELASFANVAIKISGLAMFDHRWTVESLRPIVLETIDAFGVERCMFASNSPIDRLHASYVALWESYAEIVSGMSKSETQALFVSNALRWYRLSEVSHLQTTAPSG
jgi:predicted TIM-barrel fold metal-dependent hydrolase